MHISRLLVGRPIIYAWALDRCLSRYRALSTSSAHLMQVGHGSIWSSSSYYSSMVPEKLVISFTTCHVSKLPHPVRPWCQILIALHLHAYALHRTLTSLRSLTIPLSAYGAYPKAMHQIEPVLLCLMNPGRQIRRACQCDHKDVYNTVTQRK